MIVKIPNHVYQLNEALPPLGMQVVSWPWGASAVLTEWSKRMLQYPLGTIIYDVIEGHPVIAQLQTHHNHPDWGPGGNKGTSVYVPALPNEHGHLAAIQGVPDGWGDSASSMGADASSTGSASEKLSMAALEALAKSEEEKARTVASKLPRGLTTAGGAGIGFLIGNVPGAILGGAIGLAADVWSHLVGGGDAKMAGDGDRVIFRISEIVGGTVRPMGVISEAEDSDEAAWIANRRYFASVTNPTFRVRSPHGKVYVSGNGRTMLVQST
jgi:hypothetical protein